MKRPDWSQRERHSRGQSTVEMALMLPILILVLVATVDLGRAYFAYVTVINAAREGARYGANVAATSPTLATEVETHVDQEGVGNNVTLTSSVACSPSCASGNTITVTVTCPFALITGNIIGLGNITLQATASMVII